MTTGPTDWMHGRRVRDAMVRAPKLMDSTATVGQVRELFHDDHVHVALIVDRGILLAVVERSDLDDSAAPDRPAAVVGLGSDRVVGPDARLHDTWLGMAREGRRRLAVIADDGTCLGLLCLKRSGTGFCSDAEVLSRAREREEGRVVRFPGPAGPARPDQGCMPGSARPWSAHSLVADSSRNA